MSEPAPAATGSVVVGVDGSDESVAALRTAARAAELLEATLVVVTTWLQPASFARSPLRLPDLRRETERVQAAVIATAFGDRPPAGLSRVVRAGAAGPVLVEESLGARLVVVGRRGHGGFASLLLGATAMSVVVHAHCPVLVLGRGAHVTSTDPVDVPGVRQVVVGVDGEESSLQALAAAARAATLLDARLDVVTVWSPFWGAYGDDPITVGNLRDRLEAAARAQQDAAIEDVLPAAERDRVRRLVLEGSPSAVLLEESRHADLLVVGIRSRSAFLEALGGAAAITAAAHADCPVLVVRGEPAPVTVA